MSEMKATCLRLETAVSEIRASLSRIEAVLPYLATKADVAEFRADLRTRLAGKPGGLDFWCVLAALITAYAAGLAVIAMLK